MNNWYVVYTKPKNEDSVAMKFVSNGFEVLNPKFNERKYIRRKLQEVTSHLFPCYIFVKFDLLKDYRLIKYTRGVKRVVGVENMPTAVPDEIINSIKNKMEYGIVRISTRMFNQGEEVLIKGGPFEGFNAVFEKELKSTERVMILLKAINAKVIVDTAFLEKA